MIGMAAQTEANKREGKQKEQRNTENKGKKERNKQTSKQIDKRRSQESQLRAAIIAFVLHVYAKVCTNHAPQRIGRPYTQEYMCRIQCEQPILARASPRFLNQ